MKSIVFVKREMMNSFDGICHSTKCQMLHSFVGVYTMEFTKIRWILSLEWFHYFGESKQIWHLIFVVLLDEEEEFHGSPSRLLRKSEN